MADVLEMLALTDAETFEGVVAATGRVRPLRGPTAGIPRGWATERITDVGLLLVRELEEACCMVTSATVASNENVGFACCGVALAEGAAEVHPTVRARFAGRGTSAPSVAS